jgi:fucose 4-O-acetylase-like acetyltransferase
MNERIEYVDYIKGITIFLMVMFHINYVAIIKPIMPLIYAFHMPVFLFFSGLFTKTEKPINGRLYNLTRSLLVPYLVFELIYITSLYVAGIMGFSFQNSISSITPSLLFHKLILAPIGAYWYLHTLIICMLVVYITDHFVKNIWSSIIIIGLVCFLLCQFIEGLKFNNCLFFIVGYHFRKFQINIPVGLVAIIPFTMIGFLYFEVLKRGSIQSFGLVFFFISFLGWVFNNSSNLLVTRLISHLGRNTLVIVLLHPIFLNLFKITYKWFLTFDSTGVLYLVLITMLTIVASVLCSMLMDKLYISKFLFGKNTYVPLKP